jgi:hypothetical protein
MTMGRHAREDEPVPHPLDRTGAPRVPAEGRPATPRRPRTGESTGTHQPAQPSGAFQAFGPGEQAPRRSDAAGPRQAPGRSDTSGSFQAFGQGEATGPHRTPGRSETSGSFEAFGQTEITGPPISDAHRIPGRAETSGTFQAFGQPEITGPQRTSRRGEASGTFRAATRGESTGSFDAPARGESAGSAGTPARGRSTGTFRAPARGEAPGGPVRGESTGSSGAQARSESTGTSRVPARGESTGSFRTPGRGGSTGAFPAPGKSEGTGSRRAAGRKDGGGSRRAAGRGESTGPQRASARAEDTGLDDETTILRATARGDDTGSHRVAAKSAAAKSEDTGSHRTLGKAEATGSHRIVGKKAPRRKIAGWPIACLVLAALIGLGIVGWNWADSELNSRAEAQAASCSSGTSQMRVIVTPSVQKPLTASADRWNQAATVVHGQCVHVTIEAKPSAQVLDALVGRANLDSIGGLPAAWLPESSYWVSELTTKKPELIGAPAQSVATARSADYPFIGLTGPGIDDTVLRAAQTFREYLEQPAQQADFTAAGIKAA